MVYTDGTHILAGECPACDKRTASGGTAYAKNKK